MAGYQDRTSGGGVADTGDSDSLSHRTHYKRKKSAKDKVRLVHGCEYVGSDPFQCSFQCPSLVCLL